MSRLQGLTPLSRWVTWSVWTLLLMTCVYPLRDGVFRWTEPLQEIQYFDIQTEDGDQSGWFLRVNPRDIPEDLLIPVTLRPPGEAHALVKAYGPLYRIERWWWPR